jgi:hypothetical protein
MQRRRIAWLSILLTAAVAAFVCYFRPFQTAQGRRVFVGRDVSDALPGNGAQFKSVYDPYFMRINYFSVLPGSSTNAAAISRKL